MRKYSVRSCEKRSSPKTTTNKNKTTMVQMDFDDDLSSISCVSRQLSVPSSAEEYTNRLQTKGILVFTENNGGSNGEVFENEFQIYSSSPSPSPPMNGNSTPPTELLLPKNRLRRVRGHPPWWPFGIPSFLKQYPPVLRGLFMACFVCILCASALLVFALVSRSRYGSDASSTVTTAAGRGFDLSNVLPQMPGSKDNNDIFVGDRDDIIHGEVVVTSPSPTLGNTASLTNNSETPMPTIITDLDDTQPSSQTTSYPSASVYPKVIGQAKKMTMRKGGGSKKSKKDKDEKDENTRQRRRRRRRNR